MRITIDIRTSIKSIPGYLDVQIDRSGWDCGLDADQVETTVSQYIRSTLEQMELERSTLRTG